jgi:cobalamin biosynthetic protein CobC
VVNPNNPDGRIVSKAVLLDIADELRRRGGLLVADETFADVAPADISLAGETKRDNIVVLRSFGKFFGLAGLRLGFALASPSLASRLDALLGPWAVSGPAIHVAEQALADTAWKDRTIKHLAEAAVRLDGVLSSAGLEVVGGTSLYRLTHCARADELFAHLGRAGILVRCFEEHPTWLRWGVPPSEAAWQRLQAALAERRSG